MIEFEYEYRSVHVPPHASREATSALLVIHAEFGAWELARHEIWPGGGRRVVVRRAVTPHQAGADPLPPFMT